MPGAVRSRLVKVLVDRRRPGRHGRRRGASRLARRHRARARSGPPLLDLLPVRCSARAGERHRALLDLLRAGARVTDLVIAATDRDETNIVTAMLIRSICGGKIVVRTRSSEYFDAWRAGHLDVDFIVSSEQETAQAVARAIGYPNALQTDVFAGGRVEMVEFAVDAADAGGLVGRTLADARIPAESVVASIIRPDRADHPARQRRHRGRRPARADRLARGGAGMGQAARAGGPRHRRGGRFRRRRDRAEHRRRAGHARAQRQHRRAIGGARAARRGTPRDVRVFHADATDGDFLEREAVGRADAAGAAPTTTAPICSSR